MVRAEFSDPGTVSNDQIGERPEWADPAPVPAAPDTDAPPELLAALLAAYQAGVTAVQQIDRTRAALLHQLQATATAAVLFDTEGQEQYRTPAVRDLLGSDSALVLERMRKLSRRLAAQAAPPSIGAAGHRASASASASAKAAGRRPHRAQATTRVGHRCYTLTAALHPDLLGWDGSAVVIVVQRQRDIGIERTSPAATDAMLRDHYGLTPRELDVARALCSGAAVAIIAERLKVSVHTVRRHSERVYRKLGVTTRREVTEWLMGVSAPRTRTDQS